MKDTNNYIEFKKLTPSDNIELGSQKVALDFALNEDDINNIAISGAYGSGKSSFIETYKKQDKDNRYLTISLAHFEDQKEQESGIESTLERKIINQLVHKVPAEKIPLTNFKLKENANKKDLIKSCIAIIAFIVTLSHLLLFDEWVMYVKNLDAFFQILFWPTVQSYSPIFSAIISLMVITCAIYSLIKIERNKNIFKSLKLKDAEIELYDKDDNESYFDKYLNDILYIFDNCSENVFVFEDLDRFDSVLIFERLREINNLINEKIRKYNLAIYGYNTNIFCNKLFFKTNKLKTRKKSIKFLYLLRDDIFISKDRTKFFDFLIPIIPVIDGSNSYEKIREFFFKTNDDKQKFEEQFLSDLSLYIDDMRLLENIYNEFEIYKNELKSINPDYNKLLALIVYKNIFPKDFADLQLGRSFINAVFNSKQTLLNERFLDIETKIENKQELRVTLKNEVAENIRELDLIYDNDPTRRVGYYNSSKRAEIEAEKEKRKQAIELKLKNPDIEALTLSEINNLNRERDILKSAKIKELLNNENENIAFSAVYKNELDEKTDFYEVKSNQYFGLVKYLVRYGYIDEEYSDYMTYFYPESITLQDKIFVKGIIEHQAQNYDYELNNPDTVAKRIRIIDFKENEVLNYQLMDFLLSSFDNEEKLENVFSNLKDNKKFDFIDGYLKYGTQSALFVEKFNIFWKEVFKIALQDMQSNDFLKEYSFVSVSTNSNSTITTINIDNCLSNYISSQKDYLNISAYSNSFIDNLKAINVEFVSFDIENANYSLLEKAYINDLYEINFENISMILSTFCNITNTEEILHSNFSCIIANPSSAIYKYILDDKNINTYIEEVLCNCLESISDNEKAITLILNNRNILLENKKQYITYLESKVLALSNITDNEIQQILVDNHKAVYSEENIYEYIKDSNPLTKSQVNFINSGYKELNLKSLQLSDEDESNLFDSIVKCNNIQDEKYEQCLVSLKRSYQKSFSIKSLQQSKIEILIKNNIIWMTTESLTFLREEYPDSVLLYIKHHINEYVEIIDANNFNYVEMIEILNWNIDIELKKKLLAFCNTNIQLINSNYSDDLNLYILLKDKYADSITDLICNYDKFEKNTQSQIFNIAQSNLTHIKSVNNISIDLLDKLICNNLDDDGLDLLINNINRFDKYQVQELLNELGHSKFNEVFDSNKRPHISITLKNESILDAFVKAGFISEYKESGSYYTIKRESKKSFLNRLKK